jgi:hypothetical protein
MTEVNFFKLQLELAEEESSQLRKHFVENEDDYSWDDVKNIFSIYDVRISILKSKLDEYSKGGKCSDKRIPYNGC